MKNILVTGGLGVMGSKFIESLAKDPNNNITCLDAAEQPRNHLTKKILLTKFNVDKVTFIEQRMETAPMDMLVASNDLIIHAGAHTGIPHSAQVPDDDWKSNVDATRAILEALRKSINKPPTVMLASIKPYKVDDIPCHEEKTRMVWNDSNLVGIDEKWELGPDEPYAASKMAQTALVMAYGRSYDLPVTVYRCSNLYGPGLCKGPIHGWLTWFCIAAALGLRIQLQGNGKQMRDMLFADDVLSAVLAGEKYIEQMKGEVYNIGGGKDNTISCIEAVTYLKSLGYFPNDDSVIWGPGRQHEDMIVIADYSKINKLTGWAPTVGVKQGIKSILDFSTKHKEEMLKIYAHLKL